MHVYLITNTVNGKKYVGQSIRPPAQRLASHRWTANSEKGRNRQAISRAIHKYGWGSFTAEVLQFCASQSELNDAETHWVGHHNCMVPFGYNLTSGGGNFGKQSVETIEKRAAAHRGRKCSEETKARMSKAAMGIGKGVPHSTEHKMKNAAAQTGRTHTEESKRKMSASKKGQKPVPSTPESRKKMSDAARNWWAEKKRADALKLL